MKIVVIDYGLGNVQSIKNSLRLFGVTDIVLSCKYQEILSADGVILPGVGAFNRGMQELKKRKLPSTLHDYVDSGKPLLGICLGMQLLFDTGEEFGLTRGLGFVHGSVEKFPDNLNDKLPHISWNEIHRKDTDWRGTLLNGINDKGDVYFVHSYICKPRNKEVVLSTTKYGRVEFCSSIEQKNIYACQFHPEKSGEMGLKIISNFIDIVRKNT